jgi:hypothetical protein
MVVSLMVPCEEQSWKRILPMVEDTGCDGIELNFGCPHGMSERGMGSSVGQVPEYIEMVARWCKHYSRLPVIVKLTPNITDIRYPARAAKAGNEGIRYSIPSEGTMIWFDMMAIPADAPNPDAAHAFIDFVLDPQVMAGITNFVQYGNAVPASLPHVDAAVRDNPLVFPTPEMRAKMFTVRPAGQAFDRARTLGQARRLSWHLRCPGNVGRARSRRAWSEVCVAPPRWRWQHRRATDPGQNRQCPPSAPAVAPGARGAGTSRESPAIRQGCGRARHPGIARARDGCARRG